MELKSKADISKMSFAPEFDGKNIRVILNKSQGAMVATFTGEFRGRKYFHIRELRDNYGTWNPAKGLSVPEESKKELLYELALEYVKMATREENGELLQLIEAEIA